MLYEPAGLAVLLLAASATCDDAQYALHYAAGEGDVTKVEELLAAGADPKARSQHGETALHISALPGSREIAHLLLEAGADVNARTPEGETQFMTPLMWAVYHRHVDLVGDLLEAGADPFAKNEFGKSVHEMAVEIEHTELQKMVREAMDRRAKDEV